MSEVRRRVGLPKLGEVVGERLLRAGRCVQVPDGDTSVRAMLG